MKSFFLAADKSFAVSSLSSITAVDVIKASDFSTDTQAASLKAGGEEGKAHLAVLPGGLRQCQTYNLRIPAQTELREAFWRLV